MLLINVHQLDIVLAHAVRLVVLEHQVDHVRRVLRLEREDVLVLRASQHLRERGEVDAERDVAVAAEGREGLGFEHHGDEGDVRVVHGLQRDARVVAVEVAVLHEVFDRVDDLRCALVLPLLLVFVVFLSTFLSRFACSSRASNMFAACVEDIQAAKS